MKNILVALISLLILSSSSDSILFNPPNVTANSQTGTLQKLIVSSGSVELKLDSSRLNRRNSKSRNESIDFDVTSNSFFTSIVFNDEFRGLQPGSMKLSPRQANAAFPAALRSSYSNLVVESTPWGEDYELIIRDEKTSIPIFNIQAPDYAYSSRDTTLNLSNGRLLITKEFAAALGKQSDEGVDVGTITISLHLRAIEILQVVNGETKSSVMPSVDGIGTTLVNGPDVIVGNLFGLAQFGSSSGTQVGLAVGTDSCNAGAVPLNWLSLPNNDHPVIPQNLFRMSGGASNDERFEQIGQSNVKHAFTALQENICGFGCSPTGSTTLGAGCSDPYSASLNSGGASNNLGSRAWINPFTGAYPRGDSPTPPNSHGGHSHTGPSHRILVEMNDLNSTLNAGASYFAEAQYVTPHEYAWCQAHPGECNMLNNVSYRRYSVSGTTSYSFSPLAATERSKAALTAWTGATITQIQPAPGTDGIAFVAYKVTNTAPGLWHYEYAIYNQNLDRSIQSFSIPLANGTNLTNVGFHAPPQHPGWANDGTVGNAGYSNTAWTPTQNSSSITWNTETFGVNQNANAIRWGTLYNFRFDSDRPPQTSDATIGFFKTGSPITVPIQGPLVAPSISINDVTVTEGNAGTVSANFTVTLSPASTDTVTVQYATANGIATAGSDYVAQTGTLTFTPGVTTQPVSVTVNGDTIEEPNETFFVNLTNPVNGNLVDSQGVGTINNDEFSSTLPTSFGQTQITGGLSSTTAMALHPDGRLFVCQQTGQLRVIKDGAVLPTPFVSLTVNSTGERGLLGVTFDPDYATNKFIYVYYTATTPTIHNRVSRFTADVSNEDVAVAGSEVVLMDLETLSATNHNGGAIHFGPDGKLYIATGENAVPSNAQSLSNRLGKILRINSDGTIPADNPATFPNIVGSTTGNNRAIWAVGLRNPFTFSFQQGTGRMHINDVGQSTWEEVNVGAAGANYGWPTCEGNCATAGMTNPVYQYSSAVGSPCAITGGAFYNPTTSTFPAQYISKYFFSDFCGGWMKTFDPLNPPATGTAADFITGISSPVDIHVANDGSLYYLARGTSSVYRVQYFGGSTLAINDVTITEGNSGTSTATFNVMLSPASSQTVTVQYATANGTATSPSDYTATSGTLTFTPGQVTQPVTVNIVGDTANESTETFNVNLTSPTNATLGDAQGVGTILDTDAVPELSVGDVTVTEGNSGTSNATFTISISNAAGQNVTVNYATAGDSATSGVDFLSTSGTATIIAGQLNTTVNVPISGDTMFELNETFFLNLSNPTNATISDAQAVGTINNNDSQPTIGINDVSVTEGNSGTTGAGFTVSLSNASYQTVTVKYVTLDSTAKSPIDYESVASTTLTFTSGQTTQPVNINVNGDTTFEPNETFTVNLSMPTNATIIDEQGVGTINNDDPLPTISINDVSVNEGNTGTTTATFTVSLSNPSSGVISVNYATVDGTGTAGSDYIAASGPVTFTPGQTSQSINVTLNGDTTFESNETFSVNLSAATNATMGDNQGAGTITNDDSQPTISINDVTVTEGNSGTVNATFTVSLSNPSSQSITVNYATADASASAGSDYSTASGQLTFTAGQLSQSVTVTVSGDATFESNETFEVNLSAATNSTIGDSQGVGTITNDDSQPTLSINDVTVTEGNAGTINATFSVSLSNASSQNITVNYATADGSANSGSDYSTASGQLTFTAGQLSQSISVTVSGDTMFEPNETFNVNLSGATNATINDSQGVGTITNDDSQPTISINDVSVNEGNSGTSQATFTVSLSNASSQTITVDFATAGGTATAGVHYVATNGTLSFTAGQTSQPINVTINSDELNEASVTFNVNLSTPSNATITDNQGVGTINDDDAPVLATEQNSQRAIALDDITLVRDPFAANSVYFGVEERTRVALFATNIQFTAGLSVTANALDAQMTNHTLQVEFVGPVADAPELTQVVVRLPDGILSASDLQVTITVRGKTSNVVLVGVKP